MSARPLSLFSIYQACQSAYWRDQWSHPSNGQSRFSTGPHMLGLVYRSILALRLKRVLVKPLAPADAIDLKPSLLPCEQWEILETQVFRSHQHFAFCSSFTNWYPIQHIKQNSRIPEFSRRITLLLKTSKQVAQDIKACHNWLLRALFTQNVYILSIRFSGLPWHFASNVGGALCQLGQPTQARSIPM